MPYFDTHTLYIKSEATNDQVTEAIRKIITEVSKNLGRQILSEFKANIIIDSKGKHYGYGYLRVTNPELYHILCGNNPDGTERIHYIDNPEYTPIAMEGASWADIVDDEESSKTEIRDPPLFESPVLKLSKKRQAEIKEVYVTEGITDTVPEITTVAFDAAYVNALDDKYHPNVLFTTGVPSWVDEKMLSKIFKKYSTVTDKYPIIKLRNERVEIVFSPQTRDAQFCLLITKKLQVTSGNKSADLFLKHKYRKN